ncbi:MAG: hypothetical protein GXP49_17825 [Deltaproteobacteria bacterium]|nr:hypothetical protein [Deltaproteobacteria bacterium]
MEKENPNAGNANKTPMKTDAADNTGKSLQAGSSKWKNTTKKFFQASPGLFTRISSSWQKANPYQKTKTYILVSYIGFSLLVLAFIFADRSPSPQLWAGSWMQTLEDQYYVKIENRSDYKWKGIKLVLNGKYELMTNKSMMPGNSFSTPVGSFRKIQCTLNNPQKNMKKKYRKKNRRRRRHKRGRRYSSRAGQDPCAAPGNTVPSTLKVIFGDNKTLYWKFSNPTAP